MEKINSLKSKVVSLKGIEFADPPKLIDSIDKYRESLHKYQSIEPDHRPVIVIDNGSYNCRAGWSFEETPYINFRSVVAKPKSFNKEFIDNIYLVGDECNLFESGKIQKRSAFDKNVVYHINSQEAIFDYVFSHLGVSGNSVNYPILLTEAFCNPNYSRSMISELLFECYQIPYLTYSVDFLLSFYYNQVKRYNEFPAPLSGLVVSSSYHVSHIVPIIGGRVHVQNSKRISIGGFHHNELLSKSLNQRYSVHKNKLTPSAIQEIQENHTSCAYNYSAQLKYFEDEYEKESKLIKEAQKLKRRMVLEGNVPSKDQQEESKVPKYTTKVYKNYTDYQNSLCDSQDVQPDCLIQLEWSQIEQPSEEELKRKEIMRKEQGQRLREINIKKKEEKRKKFAKELTSLEIHENNKALNEDKSKLSELGFKSMEELLERIEFLREKLGVIAKEEKKEEEKWPLINIDDADLDEEQRKMKRIQKMQKSSWLKRMEKRKKDELEKMKIEKMKTDDPENYLNNLYSKRRIIYKRMEERKERKEQMNNRDGFKRKMKTFNKIGAINDESKNKKKEQDDEDNFGMNDEDWQVYKTIAKPGYEEDDEEEDIQALEEINEQIAEVDPNFTCLYTEKDKQRLLSAEDFQIRLSTDRFRGAELLFQPSIAGYENAGLTEVLENVFHSYDQKTCDVLSSFVLLTGGNTKIQHLDDRIKAEIQMLRPQDSVLNVVKAFDPDLDAWRGGVMFARRSDFLEETSISKAQYEECGPHYLKEHFASNICYGEALNIKPTQHSLKKRQKVEE